MRGDRNRWLSSAALIAVASAAPAWAQVASVNNTSVIRTELPQVQSTPSRDAESFDPQGIRVGGAFVLNAGVEGGIVHDTNIYKTQTNEKIDNIFVLAPRMSLTSDFGNPLRLKFSAAAAMFENTNYDAESAQWYGAGVEGSYGVASLGEGSYIKAGLGHDRTTEDRGSPDNVNGNTPTVVNTSLAYLGFNYKPGALSIYPIASATKRNYNDVNTSTGAVINNDDRDRTDYREGVRIGYEFLPSTEAYVSGELNQRRYETTPDDGGFNRNSNGYTVTAGTKVVLSQITDFDVFGGFLSQDYSDARLPTVRGLTFGATANWSPLRELKFSATVSRGVEETTNANFAGFVSTRYGLRAEYQLFPQFKITGSLAYTTDDYERRSGVAVADRDDGTINASVEGKYLFTANYYLRALVGYDNRDSSVANSDYDKMFGYLGFGIQY